MIKQHLFQSGIVLMLSVVLAGCGGGGDTETSTDTTDADTTAPAMSSCTPASAATEISTTSTVICTFSEALATASVGTDTVSLTASLEDGTSALAGTVSLSSDGTQVTFTPTTSLFPNTQHCINFTVGVTDTNENPLAAAAQSCFTSMCTSSDEFTTENSLECFIFSEFSNATGMQSAEIPGSFFDAVTLDSGTLILNHNTTNSSFSGAGAPGFFKVVSGDFEVEMSITDGLPEANTEIIEIFAGNGTGDDNLTLAIAFMGGNLQVASSARVNESGSLLASQTLSASAAFLKFERTSTTYVLSYKTSADASYTALTSVTRSTANDDLASTATSIRVGLASQAGNTLGTFVPVIDYFRFNEGNAVDQE